MTEYKNCSLCGTPCELIRREHGRDVLMPTFYNVQAENESLRTQLAESRILDTEMGSDRECGHFVRTIMSFCPVCRELAERDKQVEKLKVNKEGLKALADMYQVKLSRCTAENILNLVMEHIDHYDGSPKEDILQAIEQMIKGDSPKEEDNES